LLIQSSIVEFDSVYQCLHKLELRHLKQQHLSANGSWYTISAPPLLAVHSTKPLSQT